MVCCGGELDLLGVVPRPGSADGDNCHAQDEAGTSDGFVHLVHLLWVGPWESNDSIHSLFRILRCKSLTEINRFWYRISRMGSLLLPAHGALANGGGGAFLEVYRVEQRYINEQ
jgi:hypothetical protein